MNEQPAQPGQQAPTAQQAAPAAEQQGQGAAAAAGEIRSVADITGNPATFVGDNVTVRGEIEEVYQARSFKLDDQAVAKGGIDNDLIVLGAKGATWGVDKDWGQNEVRVTGTIRKVTIEDLERDLGWRPESELREALEGERVALVAERVERAPAE